MRPNKHKGIFILVEGLDGAGKTTALKKFLNGGNQTSVPFSYLKGAATKTFLHGLARRHPHTALFLTELVWTTFQPLRQALRRGENVIMDKYFYFIASHVPDVNRPLNALLIKLAEPLMLQPDLIIYFSVDLAERLARLKAGEANPHHETLVNDPSLADYREKTYHYMVKHSGAKLVELDTTGLSVEQVVERLNEVVHNFLHQHAHA